MAHPEVIAMWVYGGILAFLFVAGVVAALRGIPQDCARWRRQKDYTPLPI